MINKIIHRGYIIEIYKDRGGEEAYYMKARKPEGTLLHSFDIDECKIHPTEYDALIEGKELIDEFIDDRSEHFTITQPTFLD